MYMYIGTIPTALNDRFGKKYIAFLTGIRFSLMRMRRVGTDTVVHLCIPVSKNNL